MAQVVIFAPPGEDVSAGESALKDAGHEVEIVEATAANLLHMAIGMIGGGEEEEAPVDEPITEPVEEPVPDEEVDPLAAEAPTTEATSIVVKVDGERIPTYVDQSAKFPLLRVVDMQSGPKVSFSINESTFSFWRDTGHTAFIKVEGAIGYNVKVKVAPAKSVSHLVLDPATAKHIGLA